MRDQAWLEQIFTTAVDEHFSDVKAYNPLRIEWGRKARTRLGSLSYDEQCQEAVIRVTKLFTDPDVPAFVVKATIVHELCHFAHGWHNGKTPQYKHPHLGGVVKEEFAERGLTELYLQQKKWLKNHWKQIVYKNYPELKSVYG